MKESHAFTLIELLVVISILTILVGIVVVAVSGLRQDAKIDATKALIVRIEGALTIYYEAFLAYPPSEGTYEGSQNLYYYLGGGMETPLQEVIQPADRRTGQPAITRDFKAPLQFKTKKEIGPDKYAIDLWKKQIYYKNPGNDHSGQRGKNNLVYVDLESYGPNGQPDDDNSEKDDDINNWKIEK